MKRILLSLLAGLLSLNTQAQSRILLRQALPDDPQLIRRVTLMDATRQGLHVRLPGSDSSEKVLPWEQVREFQIDSTARVVRPNYSLRRAMKDTAYWYRRGYIEGRSFYRQPAGPVVLTAISTVAGFVVGGALASATITASPIDSVWLQKDRRLYPYQNADYLRGLDKGARVVRRRRIWAAFGVSTVTISGIVAVLVADSSNDD